jgi:hypothetical protein
MVEGGGFEPPKAEPSDLQSDPFDHSGTPPKSKPAIVLQVLVSVNNNTALNRDFRHLPRNGPRLHDDTCQIPATEPP